MIVTCVYIHVKPEAVTRFIDATTANHRESVKEPGNLRFDLIQQADDTCRFFYPLRECRKTFSGF